MYKDNSLIPAEAVRLAALGLLVKGERPYGDLAREIRHFTGRIVGPSLELLGPSLELFKVEGLIEAADPKLPHDAQMMRLTPSGRVELKRLMTASLRGPMGEVNKLIIALKLNFLDVLDRDEKLEQCERLEEACDKELARLIDLRQHQSFNADSPQLLAWLDHEIDEVSARRRWFEKLRASI